MIEVPSRSGAVKNNFNIKMPTFNVLWSIDHNNSFIPHRFNIWNLVLAFFVCHTILGWLEDSIYASLTLEVLKIEYYWNINLLLCYIIYSASNNIFRKSGEIRLFNGVWKPHYFRLHYQRAQCVLEQYCDFFSFIFWYCSSDDVS